MLMFYWPMIRTDFNDNLLEECALELVNKLSSPQNDFDLDWILFFFLSEIIKSG